MLGQGMILLRMTKGLRREQRRLQRLVENECTVVHLPNMVR